MCWDGAMTQGAAGETSRPVGSGGAGDDGGVPGRGTGRVAVVTGASSGIGEATVRALAAEGFDVVAAARRVERCRALAAEVGGRALPLDVTDGPSVTAFAQAAGDVDVVVHCAGGALGLDRIEDADLDGWRWMYETNVLGVIRVHNALLPGMRRGGRGHVVLLGSIAGFEVYPGGGGYTAVKHAVNAVGRTLRLELNGEPIRVTEIAPGMVETPFSLVRFAGDAERAAAVYRGVTPLTAADVAEVIAFAVTRPPHVDLDQVVIRPLAQASAHQVARDNPALP
jgi:NADP-dependent 3-hydroxy acid dehydrogenase YdfG